MKQNISSPYAKFNFEIILKNHLDICWNNWFEGISIRSLDDDKLIFSGTSPDQAALFGMLSKIRDLNLKIVKLSIDAL